MMNSRGFITLLIVCSIWSFNVHGENNNFTISNFGGIDNGKTDSKWAFENAWKKACGTPGGTILIPKGNFLMSSGDFEGPCKGPTRFIIDGTLVAYEGSSGQFWLTFRNIDGLIISGTGTLNGNGAATWYRCKRFKYCDNRPTTLKLVNVKNALIQDIRLLNSKMFHLIIYQSQIVNVKNVHISAPKSSPNTDGIHISDSNYINIMDSFIGTGDDCVSMGDGSKNVKISGVFCGPGHGISIGSLGLYKGENDVSGITVTNCTLTKTQNGLRIKTWAPSQSSPVVSDVTFAHINLNSVGNPIIIDQYYCPHGPCTHKRESGVQIKGVKYIDIYGSSKSATSVNIHCSKSKPCQNINLAGIYITHNRKPSRAVCSSANVQFQSMRQDPSYCLWN